MLYKNNYDVKKGQSVPLSVTLFQYCLIEVLETLFGTL